MAKYIRKVAKYRENTLIKKKINSSCKVIYEEGLPNI
jgi:hypothetical protein